MKVTLLLGPLCRESGKRSLDDIHNPAWWKEGKKEGTGKKGRREGEKERREGIKKEMCCKVHFDKTDWANNEWIAY